MSNADAARRAAEARWGDTVLRRSAGIVLQRADLSETARAELEQIAEADSDPGD